MLRRPPWALRRTSRLACWQRRTAVGQCPCGHQRIARGHDLAVCNDLRTHWSDKRHAGRDG
eukprot:scaffold127834_cov39-Phaeocystis_antarctica.AAC.1